MLIGLEMWLFSFIISMVSCKFGCWYFWGRGIYAACYDMLYTILVVYYVLCLDIYNGPLYHFLAGVRPHLENDSISSVAKSCSKNDILLEMPAYSHWFALDIFNLQARLKQQMAENANDLTANFRGAELVVSKDRVERASEMIKNAASMHNLQENPCTHGVSSYAELRGCELTYSSIVSVALDRLVFGDFNSSGIIAHQGPVRKRARKQGNPDSSDMLGIRMSHAQPLESIYVSDIKLYDYRVSEKETALYGKFASLAHNTNSSEAVMVIGLSATTVQATLWVYIMAYKRVWGIPVLQDVKPWDPLLLATLCVGLRSLTSAPIYYNIIKSPQPLEDGSLVSFKEGPFNRTFYTSSKDKVFKIFDKNFEIYSPNIELMEMAGMEEVCVEDISTDGRFFLLHTNI